MLTVLKLETGFVAGLETLYNKGSYEHSLIVTSDNTFIFKISNDTFQCFEKPLKDMFMHIYEDRVDYIKKAIENNLNLYHKMKLNYKKLNEVKSTPNIYDEEKQYKNVNKLIEKAKVRPETVRTKNELKMDLKVNDTSLLDAKKNRSVSDNRNNDKLLKSNSCRDIHSAVKSKRNSIRKESMRSITPIKYKLEDVKNKKSIIDKSTARTSTARTGTARTSIRNSILIKPNNRSSSMTSIIYDSGMFNLPLVCVYK
jgi:hypothetical protein